ncbi:hypothetical protein F8M41_005132 [Gigaspora margarita]|uniref:Uncharacterized protein n=1 Tax=Gigaspora margarita TaxID=4874 RepID=A0A8H3X9D3_GIGMA|nr:hypothetical protein F8M41_005132 [Gigaspora margarita]
MHSTRISHIQFYHLNFRALIPYNKFIVINRSTIHGTQQYTADVQVNIQAEAQAEIQADAQADDQANDQADDQTNIDDHQDDHPIIM